MADVTIDIPGIGNVEAKNAATEATLREILKVMQGVEKSSKRVEKALTGSGGDGGKAADDNSEAQKKNTGLLYAYGKSAAIVNTRTVQLISGFGNLAASTANLMSTMANVGDSVESAASALNSIPVVGGVLSSVLGAVAGAATKSVDAFQKATSGGATFGGSINEFAASASAAGMTLGDFAGLIAQNGEALRLLGGSTADGATRFATLTKEMRASGVTRELNNLGYSTKDVNQGMANYMKYLGQTGKMGNKTNAELAAGSAKYLKEMDLLAKVTGESRAEQEAARAKLLNDAQFQAKVSNMSAEAGEAFANTVNGLPPGLRDVAKDIMVTGTATSEEAQKFSALMPKSAQMMQKFAAITESGGTITKEMQQQLQNTMAEEGKAQKANFRTQGMYNKEMAGAYMNTVQASNIQTDAIKKANAAQSQAAKGADGQAASLEESKRALAEFSNGMTMALANSGLLTTLMTVFGALASFVQTVVVPIFQILAPIISSLATTVSTALVPVFNSMGGILKDFVIPMFTSIGDFIEDNFIPVLTGVGTLIAALLIPPLMAQAAATWAIVAPLLAAAAPFVAIGIAVGVLIAGFVKMGGSISTVTDGLKSFGLGFKEVMASMKLMVLKVLDIIPGVDMSKEIEAAEKEQLEIATEREALNTKIVADMAANRDKAAAEDAKKAKSREDRDKKLAEAKHGAEKKAIDDKAKAEAAPGPVAIDYTSPEAMLKGYAAQQGSPLAKAEPKKDEKTAGTPVAKAETVKAELKPPTATAAGESTKKAMVSDSALKQAAEAQKAEAQKKTDEAAAEKSGKSKTAAAGADKSTTQESAESLLSTLNTHMAELVRISKANNRISEKQLSVQEGFGGDLFSNAAA